MCAENKDSHGVLYSVFTNKCPRCRQGNLFVNSNPYDLKTTTHMPEHCPVCGQKYELQTGFYFGTGYVSYALAIIVTGITFVLWLLTLGMSLNDNSVFWWLGVNAVILILLQPIIQRMSRSIWIAIFVPYDKNWREHEPVRL